MKFPKKQCMVLLILSILLLIILCIFILQILYYYIETAEKVEYAIQTRTLKNDGFCVLYNADYAAKTQDMPCTQLNDDVLAQLPPGYQFLDYIYKINNVALSTFHRDVTSSQYIYKTQYPVYTLILYKYDGELLSVCPQSNYTYPFNWSRIVNLDGKQGTAFLFDCDLLHAGRTNMCKERKVIQYKIAHVDDLPRLEHLAGIRNEKTDICEITNYSKMMRKLSYYFEMPINYWFYPLMVKRNDSNTILGKIQSYIPIEYYNNA